MRGPIIHLIYESQDALCGAMVRIQEFYESPFADIRGHVFTLDQYKARNAADNGGVYLYDWTGFNVPGNVVRDFFARFSPLSDDENAIKTIVNGLGTQDFYLIATHADDTDHDVVEHEICHARWYLDPIYNRVMRALVDDFQFERPDAYAGLIGWLHKRGYDASVYADEVHAYMATTPEKWWTEPEQGMDTMLATRLWNAGLPFRNIATAKAFGRPTVHTIPFTARQS